MSETDDLAAEDLPTLTEQGQKSAVSEMLIQARQAKNLSQQDVADKLFLTVTYIRYIDEGRFHKIPKPAFTRGYLRSYARIVGVSGDEVVKCFDKASSNSQFEPDSLRNVTEEEVGPATFTGPVAQTGFIGLAGVGLLIFLVWWLTPSEEGIDDLVTTAQSDISNIDADVRAADSSIRVEAADPVSAGLTDPSERVVQPDSASIESSQQSVSGDSSAQQPTPAAVGGTDVASSILDDAPASIEPSTVEQTTVERSTEQSSAAVELPVDGDASTTLQSEVTFDRYQEGEHQIITVLANGEDHLRFTFVDECWLEVEDAEGNALYGDLNHASDIVDIYGQAPFKILIGRAQSVTLLFNDQPFDLVPHIENDTSKLVVGN